MVLNGHIFDDHIGIIRKQDACEKIHWYFHEEEDNSEKTSFILSHFELPHKVRMNRRMCKFTHASTLPRDLGGVVFK
ncbi:hypothetical protein KDA_46920 [Dictyobacter alpinus]|uniref:Uncharacterized protein n=1 Tax=Dictyobacter alpinus TaxID=2014873 RepID=A0A402BCT7_9CHLR|nr:hypothetical protein KDA_46920 [Dictyobacter alpinus]